MLKPTAASCFLGAFAFSACASELPTTVDADLVAAASIAAGQGHRVCPEPCFLPGISEVYRGQMAVQAQNHPFTLIHGVLDFQPGSWFPAHGHGGPTLYTLVEGSVTVHHDGDETVYGAGESYHHEPGELLAASNAGPERSLMAVAFVLPAGEEMIHFPDPDEPGPDLPPPGMLHGLATGLLELEGPFTVTQLALDLREGATAPVHPHPGPVLVTVLEGHVTLRIPGMADESIGSGDGWMLRAEQRVILANEEGSTARLIGTFLVPEGETLSRPHGQAFGPFTP